MALLPDAQQPRGCLSLSLWGTADVPSSGRSVPGHTAAPRHCTEVGAQGDGGTGGDSGDSQSAQWLTGCRSGKAGLAAGPPGGMHDSHRQKALNKEEPHHPTL